MMKLIKSLLTISAGVSALCAANAVDVQKLHFESIESLSCTNQIPANVAITVRKDDSGAAQLTFTSDGETIFEQFDFKQDGTKLIMTGPKDGYYMDAPTKFIKTDGIPDIAISVPKSCEFDLMAGLGLWEINNVYRESKFVAGSAARFLIDQIESKGKVAIHANSAAQFRVLKLKSDTADVQANNNTKVTLEEAKSKATKVRSSSSARVIARNSNVLALDAECTSSGKFNMIGTTIKATLVAQTKGQIKVQKVTGAWKYYTDESGKISVTSTNPGTKKIRLNQPPKSSGGFGDSYDSLGDGTVKINFMSTACGSNSSINIIDSSLRGTIQIADTITLNYGSKQKPYKPRSRTTKTRKANRKKSTIVVQKTGTTSVEKISKLNGDNIVVLGGDTTDIPKSTLKLLESLGKI